MKTTTDYMGNVLGEFTREREQNFGSIPDDYRQFIEDLLENAGPVAVSLSHMIEAAKHFPEFLSSMKKLGFLSTVVDNDEVQVNALKVNGSDMNFKKLIKENWKLFEPPFLFLYLGMKMGQQKEREEGEKLKKLAALEDRRKANPNSFDSIGPDPERLVLMQPVSDTAELPAISPEKAEKFRQEMEAELKAEQDSGESTDKAA